MEPEGSSPHSQAHVTCPYPEPAPSSPHTHIPLPEDPSEYYPPIYAWVSPVVSFSEVSPPKPCTRLSPPPYALHAPPISFFLILSPAQYWVRSTDYSSPRYEIFSIPLAVRTIQYNILLFYLLLIIINYSSYSSSLLITESLSVLRRDCARLLRKTRFTVPVWLISPQA